MSWRIVAVSQRAKLDLKLDSMVVRGETTVRVHLSELGMLIIENTAVSLTAALLCELSKRKVKVIFCDEKRNPSSELVSYYGSHDTSFKVRQQVAWKEETKNLVWTKIVTEKIQQQRECLFLFGHEQYKMLDGYLSEIELADITNREGHAAKVYFNALFGMDFSRSQDSPINSALNYGYGILLSTFNREVVANGYITQLGLFHDNMFNQFNLSSDLMEPFRPLIDNAVCRMNPAVFGHDEKMRLVDVLNSEAIIDDRSQYVINAIKIYCKGIFDALNSGDMGLIRFYRNEL